jgi:hypothetical protein
MLVKEGFLMISHCANPNCRTPLHYLRGGRLYRFDVKSPAEPCRDVPNAICANRPAHASVFFWLCEECCSRFSLQFDLHAGVTLLPERVPARRRLNTPLVVVGKR